MVNTKHENQMKYFFFSLWLLLAMCLLINAISSIHDPIQRGDEYFYLQELARYQHDGLWKSFSGGISHLHVVLANFLELATGSALLGGRLLSILLLPLSLLAGIGIIRNLKLSLEIELLTITSFAYVLCVSKSGMMFYGFYNDSLMITLALTALYFLQKYCHELQARQLVMAAVFTGMMFWVRTFSIMILGGILAFVIVMFAFHKPRIISLLRVLLFIGLVTATASLVQIPSLIDNGKYSFESKGSRSTNEGHWINRLYRPSSSSIFAYPGVSQEIVAQYKKDHGAQSIPGTLSERIAQDPKFMVDNFASNLVVRVPYILLISIGMYFLLFLDALRRPGWLFRDSKNATGLLHFFVFTSVCMGLSIIIFNYIEQRWMLIAIFSGSILGAMHLDRRIHGKFRTLAVAMQWSFLLLGISMRLIDYIM